MRIEIIAGVECKFQHTNIKPHIKHNITTFPCLIMKLLDDATERDRENGKEHNSKASEVLQKRGITRGRGKGERGRRERMMGEWRRKFTSMQIRLQIYSKIRTHQPVYT